MGKPEELMTSKEVSDFTNGVVSESTLRWWRHKNDGTGPVSFKLGARKVVYRRSDVERWLEESYAKEAV